MALMAKNIACDYSYNEVAKDLVIKLLPNLYHCSND